MNAELKSQVQRIEIRGGGELIELRPIYGCVGKTKSTAAISIQLTLDKIDGGSKYQYLIETKTLDLQNKHRLTGTRRRIDGAEPEVFWIKKETQLSM